MAQHLELDAFYAVLEKTPSDVVTQLALADWYEENNESQAALCLRWLADHRHYPFRYSRRLRRLRHHHDTWKNYWYWWTTDSEGEDWGLPTYCALPHRTWTRLKHGFPYDPLVFKEYPTVRAAIEALIRSWPRPRKRTTRSRGTS
ncbi:MAG: hypothetical protein U0840_22000 [Gemmataceae bacterium]